MPRIARREILYDGCYAHIISRSIRKMKLFREKADFQELYQLFAETKRQACFKIYHYCFMHTHFHLAVSIPDIKEFSNALRDVKSQYSHKFHAKYHLSGPIWNDRYRGLLIENEAYLQACGTYIENNPVKAGFVKKANDWKFSSSRHYQGEGPDLLVDNYADSDNLSRAVEIDFEEEEFFEHGHVIGSAFYRWQLYEKKKRS